MCLNLFWIWQRAKHDQWARFCPWAAIWEPILARWSTKLGVFGITSWFCFLFSFIPVIKEYPFQVAEAGYAGFLMPIEVYFKNKEEPKKVIFQYDLFLHLAGQPPVNHIRCEKLTFNNPTEDFRRKLIKAGGVSINSFRPGMFHCFSWFY